MRIILLHSDFIEVEPLTKAIEQPEDISKEKKRVEECLVVLSAVEKADEEHPEVVAKNAADEIASVAEQVKTNTIVIYPWVHLTSSPSRPNTALDVLKKIEASLREKKYDVHRQAFGWYKAFQLRCKGHPLSELSREIKPLEKAKDDESKALQAERKLTSKWFIMDNDGELKPIEIESGNIKGHDFTKSPKLKSFCMYEMAKSREVKEEPPHVKLMRKHELADYEPGSDPGHLRYPPKGKMMKALIEEHVTKTLQKYGAMEIESPIMFDYDHPSLRKYLDRFPARQYTIETPNKKVFLRFAACFGQFLMLHDAVISYRHLPMWMYEMTKYSFRVEKRGELTGLRRLRAFSMPDCHAFCADLAQAKKEFIKRLKMCMQLQKEFGLEVPGELELALRLVRPFYNKQKAFVKKVQRIWGKPILVEMWEEQAFYFAVKYELNFVDNLQKASALSTDQIDIENAERYDINYVDAEGKKQHPLILHCSPSGASERIIYALLEKAFERQQQGKKYAFPLWLSPTQVRFASVSKEFLKDMMKIANRVERKGIRVDVDDRDESVGKKISLAEQEWVPLTVVFGEKEQSSGKLMARFRESGEQKALTEKELIKYVKEQCKGKPFRPIPMAKLLSMRPTFIG